MNYEKVSIVDHSEILPPFCIPCFNSVVIEYFLAFIPNLSEKFLYGNDDTFFGEPVTPDYFFDGDKPIVRVKKLRTKKDKKNVLICANNSTNYSWVSNIFNSLKILNKYYNINNYYQPHHNIDAYSKNAYLSTYRKFEDKLQKCFTNKFRNANDFERIIFSLDAVYSGNAKLKIVSDPKPFRRRLHWLKNVNWNSYCGIDTSLKDQREIVNYKPILFCLNSSTKYSLKDKLKSKHFMEKLFPYPSKFEL